MNVIILGAGESGTGAAILAKKMNLNPFVSDQGMISEEYKAEMNALGIPFEEGQHTEERILSGDIIIKSPGIPDKVELIKKLKSLGKKVISEIEFASYYNKTKTIAITGSNGKTTTTNLLNHLLTVAGMDVRMGGNVGYSFARLVAEDMDKPKEFYVLELSSFQLDGIETYRPDIAILLNITPDHLDRYEYKMENYVQSKFRINMAQLPTDTMIYNAIDKEIQQYLTANTLKGSLIPIEEGFFDEKNKTIWWKDVVAFDMSKSALKGKHNMFNAICSIHAAVLAGARFQSIQQGLESFVAVPHRLEFVANVNGVEYINDSKATNVDSVFYGLGAMEKPTVWIVGGQDKGNDYDAIADLVREKVKAIVCMGVDNKKLFDYFGSFGKPISEAKSAEEAVSQAANLAKSGDVVLLSPACASFDLFKNYEDRGAKFKNAVLMMKDR